METQEKILMEENEQKPNTYVANVFLFMVPFFILFQALNEFGIFHVNPTSMRCCMLVSLICVVIIQFIARGFNASGHHRTKYYVMILACAITLFSTIVLSQWTELLLALPLCLAMQYHSKTLTRFTIVATFIIGFMSAPLSVLFGFPQITFYEYLIENSGYLIDGITSNPNYNVIEAMGTITLYVSIPRCFIIGILSLICVYITKLSSENIDTRAEVTLLSSTDILTGALNRLSYENKIDEYEEDPPAKLICVFGDVNGLHSLNNQNGHKAGDLLLQACGKEMMEAFGPNTYRIGGDEFVSFIESDDIEAVEAAVQTVQKNLAKNNSFLSMGITRLTDTTSIDEMIREAEENMYKAKRAFYSMPSHDRRKNRRILQDGKQQTTAIKRFAEGTFLWTSGCYG